MNAKEATALAARVSSETGLRATIGDDSEGEFWVDVEMPTQGEELQFVVTAHDPDDWPWLHEKYVRARLDPDG
jgi:hypothetical protein